MDGRETTTRREPLRTDAEIGAAGAAVIRGTDAIHYVDDLSVRAEPR